MAATQAVKDAIIAAIRQGAPIYNSGNPGGCYELYRSTAQGLLESGLVSAQSKSGSRLREAMDKADGSVDIDIPNPDSLPSDVSDYLILDASSRPTQGTVTAPDSTSRSQQPSWFALDDVIMGGVSSSTIQHDKSSDALVFQGLVTTESNGGFASVRSAPWPGWARFGRSKGMRLLLQGDGRVYKVTAKTDDNYDGVQYQHDFATGGPSLVLGRQPTFNVPQGWQVVDLPFKDFTPNFRGRPVRNQPPLSGTQIRQLGLMVSKFAAERGTTPGFRSGPFRLAIRSIHAFL